MVGEAISQSGDPADWSNEQLFWGAYGSDEDTGALFAIGNVIDERITSLTSELRSRYEIEGQYPEELRGEHSALMLAIGHIDEVYGRQTGEQRTGEAYGRYGDRH